MNKSKIILGVIAFIALNLFFHDFFIDVDSGIVGAVGYILILLLSSLIGIIIYVCKKQSKMVPHPLIFWVGLLGYNWSIGVVNLTVK